jgi:MFS family permease
MQNAKPTPGLFFVSACMLLVGMQMAETGASLDRMAVSLGLSALEEGVLVSARFAGGIVLGLVLWLGSARVRIRAVLLVALSLVAASSLLLLVPSFASALAVAVMRGLAVGAIIPLSGMYAASQSNHPSAVVTSTVNAAVSVGLVLVSGLAWLLAEQSALPWQSYWAPAGIGALVVLAIGARVRLPSSTATASGQAERSLARRTNWPFACAGLFVVAAESVLLGLIPVQSARLSGRPTGAGTPTGAEEFALLLMLGVLLGRFAAARLSRRLSARSLLAGSVAALFVSGTLWALFPSASFLFLPLLGLSTAGLFPALIATVADSVPSQAGGTIAAVGWTGGVGGTLLPALTGAALQAGLMGSLSILFVVGAALLALGSSYSSASTAARSTERPRI